MGSFVTPPPLLVQGRAGNLARAARALDDARAAPQDAALRMRSAEMAFLQAEDAVFQTAHVRAACARGAMDVRTADMLVAISEPVTAAMGMVGALIVCAPPPGVAQAMVAALEAASSVLRGVAAAWDGADVDVADAAQAALDAAAAVVEAAATPATDVAVIAAVSGVATTLTRAVRAAQVAAAVAAEVGR
jgi:hypothetical protein